MQGEGGGGVGGVCKMRGGGEEWPGNHPHCQGWCLLLPRSIVCSPRFMQLVNDRDILFWAVDVQSEEGKRGRPCHILWVCPVYLV